MAEWHPGGNPSAVAGCAFAGLLESIRRAVANDPRAGGGRETLTDEEAFAMHLAGASRPWTHSTVTGEREVDNKPCTMCERIEGKSCGRGRRECMGQRVAERIRDHWRRYFARRRVDPPEFLINRPSNVETKGLFA